MAGLGVAEPPLWPLGVAEPPPRASKKKRKKIFGVFGATPKGQTPLIFFLPFGPWGWLNHPQNGYLSHPSSSFFFSIFFFKVFNTFFFNFYYFKFFINFKFFFFFFFVLHLTFYIDHTTLF
jgi:hypothetical protein